LANALVPNDAPLFAFETLAGGWAPMMKPWFMESVSEVWKVAGLQYALDGHGFQIGGASEVLMQGFLLDAILTQGWWKLHTFLEYWWQIEAILPMFITQSYFTSQYSMVQSSMVSFHKKYNC
jgi:hypothetical protein